MLLDEMEIFYYVVEFKSFSKAAAHLNVSKSYISKKITKLEQELKIHLLSRSTRKLTLSEAGENLYQFCANIVREGQDAYSMLSELKGKPSGVLKISMPPALGVHFISSMLPQFLLNYPEVKLDIQLENRLVDLLKEGYDLVLRSAVLESSNLIAQRIYSINTIICATETYLQTHSALNVASDLEKHNCLIYNYSKKAAYLTLIKNNKQEMIHIQGNFMSNHLDLIKQMVLNNVGIGILPRFMVNNELQAKMLKHCLPTYRLPESELYAIYPERKFILPKLRVFLDMLKSHLTNI